MFFAVVAHSEDIDTEGALNEIVEQCQKKLGERQPKAGIIFSARDLEHDHILEGIDDAWPGLELIGCTTDGEISSELGFREDSITLVLFGSDRIEFAAGLGATLVKISRPPVALASRPPRRSPLCHRQYASPCPKA